MPDPRTPAGGRWVVVDTDTGLDDAHALMYLLAQPDVDVLGVTTVFGNTVVENAARNVATVLDIAGRPDVPIYLGAAGPLEGEAAIDTFWHGLDGLGDRGLPGPDAVLQPESAAEFLVRIANEHPGQVDLLAIGPLTNLALALGVDRDLLGKFRSVVIMGGGGPYPAPGGLTLTDANSHHDRAATERVYTAPNAGNVVMVGVNVTLQALLDDSDYHRLRQQAGAWAQFAATLLDASNETYQYTWGRRVSAAHDGLASVVLHRPDLRTAWVEGPVTFTPTAGSFAVQVARTYDGGPLSFETRVGPSIRAVTAFDESRFRLWFLQALSEGGRPPIGN
ncbi:MAG: nucleoside hydrolase [Actinomycetota bacterium]|nr:nucleoside hydrolase [Actinomycetota bacterium]